MYTFPNRGVTMNDERITPLREYPVTIVAFIRESEESLLIASDSQFTSGDIRMTASKLRQIPNEKIMWSCAGNPSIGLDEFGDWINTYDFKDVDWATFAKIAITQLSRLNGEQKGRTELSGMEYKPESMGAEILIVGWLNGKPNAYILSENGTFTDVLQHEFWAIGTGGRYARIAKYTVDLCGQKGKLSTFKIVMEIIARHVQDCCLPVESYRIKKDSIERAFGFGE